MQSPRTEFVHFKNGLFHGSLLKDRKNGEAICLYDNGAVFVGSFKADQLSGNCLILLSPDTYFIGGLKRGMLDGSFTVRSPDLHIYSQTIMNRIQGEVVVIDRQNKRARVWEIEKAQGICIREAQYDEYLSEQKILRAVSPYTEQFPSILEYFLLNNSSSVISALTSKGKETTEVFIQDSSTRKLTLHFEGERLVKAGITEEGELMGFGYLYDRKQGVQLEGQISNGAIDGEGVKRDLTTGRSIFGKFAKGDIRSLQSLDSKGETVQTNLLNLKKRIHLHALEFTNDYLNQRPIYLLRNFYELIAENQVKYTQYLRQVTIEKGTPVRAASTLGLNRQPSRQELTYNINEYNMIKNALSSRR